MKRIYITGMSGTGKSSVIQSLAGKSFQAIDTDYNDWCELLVINGEVEWALREEKFYELLQSPATAPLFVAGCSFNQSKFYSFFQHIVLFSAPLEVMLQRVAQRTSHDYGKNQKEISEIIWNYEHVQPLLKKRAGIEINTALHSVEDITETLIKLASE